MATKAFSAARQTLSVWVHVPNEQRSLEHLLTPDGRRLLIDSAGGFHGRIERDGKLARLTGGRVEMQILHI